MDKEQTREYHRAWRKARRERLGLPEPAPKTQIDAQEAIRLYRSGLSTFEVAKELGCSAEHVRRTLKRQGEPRRGQGAAGRRRENNHFYSQGYTIDKGGYRLVLHPDRPGYIREHRLVMGQHLGRPLRRNEVVHHKNGDRADNRIENLEVFRANGEHLAETLKGQVPKWTEDGKRRIQEAVRRPRGPRRASTPTE